MNRRSLIKFGSMAALGFAVEGCAPTSAAKPQVAPRAAQARRVLPVVNASWDRIIRTTIGLRPHRPSGFVLRAEKLDNKTLIHNFGHGGSGMSLSWGTASMATDLALPHEERKAAVLGSGVVGLTSARELQRHGFDVTIYAATRSARHDFQHVAGGMDADIGARRQPAANGGVGRTVPARGAHRVSAAAVADRSEVRRVMDQTVPADGQRAIAAESQSEPESRPAAGVAGSSWDRARSRRASVRDQVLLRARRNAHRAVDLSRRADERLPVVGRQGRDPQVRYAARRRRSCRRT